MDDDKGKRKRRSTRGNNTPDRPNDTKDDLKSSKGQNKDPSYDGTYKEKADKPNDISKGVENKNDNKLDKINKNLGGKNDDSLKEKAIDKVMDLHPVSSNLKGARKALKDLGPGGKKGKNSDFVDGVKDKAKSEALKAGAVGTGVAGAGTGAGMVGGALVGKAIGAVKTVVAGTANVFSSIASGVGGFFSSMASGAGALFSNVAGAIGGVLGIGSTASAVVTGATTVTVVSASIFTGGLMVDSFKTSGGTLCVPDNTKVSAQSQEYIIDGEHAIIRKQNIEKIWSVYSEMGASKEQTAAVIGNLKKESSLDPTRMETIEGEWFQIGSKKVDAMTKDYNMPLINPSYSNRFPNIKQMGIGLAQWTNDRNILLRGYAEEKGGNWYDFDMQIMFMFDGDQDFRQDQLREFLTDTSSGDVATETGKFMAGWIGLPSGHSSLSERKANALESLIVLEEAIVDTAYAEGVLAGINVDASGGNYATGAYHNDDGCGEAVLTHYSDKEADGTGKVPDDLVLKAWKPDDLPESLKKYSVDPKLAGLSYGSRDGWYHDVQMGQCVGFSSSYFVKIYPNWDKNGRPTERPYGDGRLTAKGWAEHYGEPLSKFPQSGSVFSDSSTSVWGHTGIVQHVFANGDILIAEQNLRGVSGDNNGTPNTWGFRIIRKDKYKNKWDFFKPSTEQPQWVRPVA